MVYALGRQGVYACSVCVANEWIVIPERALERTFTGRFYVRCIPSEPFEIRQGLVGNNEDLTTRFEYLYVAFTYGNML